MQTTPLQPDTYTLMEQQLNSLIKENRYISETVSNKKKDQNSLSSIVIRQLSQSDCIKLGTGIEKLLVDLILQKSEHSELKDIKPKNIWPNIGNSHQNLYTTTHTKNIL